MNNENLFAIILFSIVGISLLARFAIILYRYITIRKWLPIAAKIIDFNYEQTENEDSLIWERKAKYMYNIGDIVYFNNKLSNDLVWGHNSRGYAEYWYDKQYVRGEQITVYYNPYNPSESVIENTFGFLNYILLAFSLVCFFIVYYNAI